MKTGFDESTCTLTGAGIKGGGRELDLANCVAVCFYEHLVDDAAVRADMPRWLSDETFEAVESLFKLRLGSEEEVEMLKCERAEYKKRNPAQRFRPRKGNKRR